jgi:peptidylprolyl isomerase/foldase protein PrsA
VAALGLVVSTSLSACSSVEPTALRVDGRELSGSEFDELLAGYALAIPNSESPAGTVNSSVARGLLSDWATTNILNDRLAEQGVTLTDADLAEARAGLEQQAGFAEAAPAAQDFYVLATAVQTVFASTFGPSSDELRQTYDAGPRASGVYCLRAILVTDAVVITEIDAQLAGGGDFAELAAQYSIDGSAADGGVISDPGSGLTCFDQVALSSQIVPEFATALADAEIGTPTDPFELPGVGWVIALLRPYDEVADDVRELVGLDAAETERLDAISSAEVWVSAEYGVWDSATGRVVPA